MVNNASCTIVLADVKRTPLWEAGRKWPGGVPSMPSGKKGRWMNPTPRLLKAIEPSKAIPSCWALSTKLPKSVVVVLAARRSLPAFLPLKKAAARAFWAETSNPKQVRQGSRDIPGLPLYIDDKNIHLDKTVLGLSNGCSERIGCLDTLGQDGLYLLRSKSPRSRAIAKWKAIIALLIHSDARSQTSSGG